MAGKKIGSYEELLHLSEDARRKILVREGSDVMVSVCTGGPGNETQAHEVARALAREIEKRGLRARVGLKESAGLPVTGTVVEVRTPREGVVLYGDVTPDIVPVLLKEHLLEGRIVREHLLSQSRGETFRTEL
jgi:(2Fe-2S) ferredoxin